MIYNAPKTIRKFMLSGQFARFVIGPLGSGKTAGMIIELTRRMREQAPDSQGVRPTRFAVVRNTLQQLRQTVLPDILTWLGPIAQFKFTDSTIYFNFLLDDGTRVKSEWLLIPLDTPEDQKRLLSLQLTGAWLAEFRELPFSICAAVMGRVGRYPSPAVVKPTWQGVIGESNPFSEGSEWYENLVLTKPANWEFLRQPGGLSPEAENRENLPDNYYERLTGSAEWKKVHIDADYGDDLSGQAVFRASFSPAAHISDTRLLVNPHRPVMVGLDFGRTPTALLTQVDAVGRLIVFDELLSVDMGLHKFISTLLLPMLHTDKYGSRRVFVVADPAGRFKDQQGELSLFDVIQKYGIIAYPAPTNDIGRRLNAVEELLTQRRGDSATALLIDRQGCPMLCRAMQRDYKYARKQNGVIDDKPDKAHPWSDLCFVAGTLVATPSGPQPIETLSVGDFVLTHLGPRPIEFSSSRATSGLVSVRRTDGVQTTCTEDHPYIVDNVCVPAIELQPGTILEPIKCAEHLLKTSKSSRASDITVQKATNITGTSMPVVATRYTNGCGSTTTVLCQKGSKFTIKCATWAQQTWKTLNSWSAALMRDCMLKSAPLPALSNHQASSRAFVPLNGIGLQKGLHGMRIMAELPGLTQQNKNFAASNVLLNTKLYQKHENGGSVARLAKVLHAGKAVWTTYCSFAKSALHPLRKANIQNKNTVLVVAEVSRLPGSAIVYNLQVAEAHTFYADGALVHNCDALQYAALGVQINATGRIMQKFTTPPKQKPRLTAAAWT